MIVEVFCIEVEAAKSDSHISNINDMTKYGKNTNF